MVSSELVVLLIVCVGINTGSAQQGELTENILLHSTCTCEHNSLHYSIGSNYVAVI